MTAEIFSWHHGIITDLVKHSAGAGRDVSMVDNEHLKCTAMQPLYITSENAVSRTS